jgi:hypothetical protein
MHRATSRWFFLVYLPIACGAACSSPSAGEAKPEEVRPATEVMVPDAGDDSALPETPQCLPAIASATVDEALLGTEAGTSSRIWIVRARDGETFLTLTVRESQGAVPGVGSGSFGKEQLRPAEAQVSLLVQTDCVAHGDHYHCGPSYVPTAGTWAFTPLPAAVGEDVVVELSAELAEAKVRSGNVTLVAGGKAMCLDKLSVRGTLERP